MLRTTDQLPKLAKLAQLPKQAQPPKQAQSLKQAQPPKQAQPLPHGQTTRTKAVAKPAAESNTQAEEMKMLRLENTRLLREAEAAKANLQALQKAKREVDKLQATTASKLVDVSRARDRENAKAHTDIKDLVFVKSILAKATAQAEAQADGQAKAHAKELAALQEAKDAAERKAQEATYQANLAITQKPKKSKLDEGVVWLAADTLAKADKHHAAALAAMDKFEKDDAKREKKLAALTDALKTAKAVTEDLRGQLRAARAARATDAAQAKERYDALEKKTKTRLEDKDAEWLAKLASLEATYKQTEDALRAELETAHRAVRDAQGAAKTAAQTAAQAADLDRAKNQPEEHIAAPDEHIAAPDEHIAVAAPRVLEAEHVAAHVAYTARPSAQLRDLARERQLARHAPPPPADSGRASD